MEYFWYKMNEYKGIIEVSGRHPWTSFNTNNEYVDLLGWTYAVFNYNIIINQQTHIDTQYILRDATIEDWHLVKDLFNNIQTQEKYIELINKCIED